MNILEITTFLRGGAGAFLTRLACDLKKRGHCIDVISSGQVGELVDWDELLKELEMHNINHYTLNFFKRDNEIFWSEVKKLANIISNNDYDAIHVHAGVPALACYAARSILGRDIPIIATFHSWSKNRPQWMDISDSYAFNKCEKVIYDSEEYMRFGESKGIKVKSKVIYPGLMIDEKVYEIEKNEVRRRLVQKLNLPNDSFIITNLAEITDRKGQIDLVKALRYICDVREDVYLCLIGEYKDRNYYNKLLDTIERLSLKEKVFLLGWVKDPHEIITASDIFAFPSYSEGLGLAIVEAISLGIPTIFSSVEGTKDIEKILESSCIGTFEPGDYERIATLVIDILHKNQEIIYLKIKESTEKINKVFNFNRTVDSYERAMKTLLISNK